MKRTCLSLVILLSLAAPALGAADDNTLVITLRGLPAPSIHAPRSEDAPHASPYRQPPVQAAPLPEARPDDPAARARSAASLHDVVGRLGLCVWPAAPIYRGQDGGGLLVARVARGTYLAIKSDYAGWYGVLMIDGTLGWIQKNAVQLLDYNVIRPPVGSAETSGAVRLGADVLKEAFKYLGVPYVWGGNGRSGLDCSGLVKNCFAECGVWLPRRASEQARVGQPVPLTLSALRPGDRLYFAVGRASIDHTGIYLGNGYFIHASMSRGRVAIDHLSKPLYSRHLVAARRTEADYPPPAGEQQSQALIFTRHPRAAAR